jgi:diguanylate cyclase (GGDEF)-like protein
MTGPREEALPETIEAVQNKNFQMTELMIAKFRWLVIGFLFLQYTILRPEGSSPLLVLGLLALASAYNGGISWFVRRSRVFSVGLTLLFLYCDMIAVTLGMLFTGGVASPFLFIWYIMLFTAGIRFGFARSFLLQVPLALCYAYLLHRQVLEGNPDFLSKLVLGLFSLSAVSLFGAIFLREGKYTMQALSAFHQGSITDRLTGLNNYAYFMDELKKEEARAARRGTNFALIIFDLDHFKMVNDTYGHEKGNLLLKSVAAILKASARRMDTVARYGGEEFVLLMPDSNGAEREVAERIRKKVESTEFPGIGDGPLRITISGGICSYPREARSMLEILDKADRGLYAAKDQGRNRTCSCEPVSSLQEG